MSRANDAIIALIDQLATIDGTAPYTTTVVGVERGINPRWKNNDGVWLYIAREELVQVTPGAHQQSRARLDVDVWVIGSKAGDNAAVAAEVLVGMEEVLDCIWADMYLGGVLKTYGGRIHPSAASSSNELSERHGRYIGVVTLLCTYQATSR